MAELGILGIVIPEEYGGAGLDFVCEALACEEIERGEAAFRTLISVHVGLNSLSLLRYGTEEQKQRWLVPQAQGEKLACFGLTEPGAGSDVAAMRVDGAARGRRLRPERPEELDLVRDGRRPRARLREDRPRGGPQGDHAPSCVEKGMPGFTTRATRRTSSASGPARPASSSSRTSRCRPRTGSARRARVRDRDALARPRPVHGRGRRAAASCAPASSGRSSTHASARRSGRRSAVTSSSRT